MLKEDRDTPSPHRLLEARARPRRAACLPLQLAAAAQAAPLDPLGFSDPGPVRRNLVVHENAGSAVITVTRDPLESLHGAQVRYITSGDGFNPATNSPFQCGAAICTATSDDFTSVKGQLNFDPGETSKTFSVPIVDHGFASVPKTFQVSLFGPSPIGLGPVSKAPVTILEDDPADAITLRQPARAAGGADRWQPARGSAAVRRPAEPGGDRGASRIPALQRDRTPAGYRAVRLLQLQLDVRPGHRHRGLPLPDPRRCRGARARSRCCRPTPSCTASRGNGDSPAQQAAYHNFITGFAQGIGSLPRGAVPRDGLADHDARPELATGSRVRMAELSDAINILTANCPRLVDLPRRGCGRRAVRSRSRRRCSTARASRRSRGSSSTRRTSTGPRRRSRTATRSPG